MYIPLRGLLSLVFKIIMQIKNTNKEIRKMSKECKQAIHKIKCIVLMKIEIY